VVVRGGAAIREALAAVRGEGRAAGDRRCGERGGPARDRCGGPRCAPHHRRLGNRARAARELHRPGFRTWCARALARRHRPRGDPRGKLLGEDARADRGPSARSRDHADRAAGGPGSAR
jgi:hypothetical protein